MGYSKLMQLEGIKRQIALERDDRSALSAKGCFRYFRYFCSTTAFLFLVLFTYMQTLHKYSGNKQISVTKMYGHLLCNKLSAYTHALDMFTCCAHGKQYQLNQILVYDLVKPVFLIQKHCFSIACLKKSQTLLQALAQCFWKVFVSDGVKQDVYQCKIYSVILQPC